MVDETKEKPVPNPEEGKDQVSEAVSKAVAPLNQRISDLETELSGTKAQLEKSNGLVAEKEKGFVSLTAERDGVVKHYGELVKKTNPTVPSDMITGATVGEINASLAKGLSIVDQVKKSLESQAQKQTETDRVPPGSPGRTEPDASTMTSKDKITFGLNKARSKSR